MPAIMLAGCSGTGADTLDDTPSRLAVTRGDLVTRLLLTGELVAGEAEQLVVPDANVWPVTIRWLAEDGIEVQEGDPVVEFDNSQVTSNLDQLRAQRIEQANQLVVVQARTAADESAAAFEVERRRAAAIKARLEAEVPAEVIAQSVRDERRLALDKAELELAQAEVALEAERRAARSDLEVQRIKLARAEAALDRAQERLELLVLRAVRDGILVLANHPWEERPLQVGDGTYPGWLVGRLPDLTTMMVSARLSDVDDGLITPGRPVAVTLDAFPGIDFAGTVREIDPIASEHGAGSSRRFFRVEIDLERVDLERMRPGMSVKVVLETSHDDVLIAPRQSLDWTPNGARALRADGTWAPVTLGACNPEACALGAGLAEGARLARVAPGWDDARMGGS